MNPSVRLAAALSLSGFLISATAGGTWPLALAALLWAAPMLIAVRSLRAVVAWPVALVPFALGRAVGMHDALDADSAWGVACATTVLVPVLALDRFATTWAPRAGMLVWPAALVVAERALTLDALGPHARIAHVLLAPLPAFDTFRTVGADLGLDAAVVFGAVLCNGFAIIGATLNRRVADPYAQEQRERGAKIGSIGALILGLAVLVVAFARDHVAGFPTAAPVDSGDAVVVICALALTGATVTAFATRRLHMARPAPAAAP